MSTADILIKGRNRQVLFEKLVKRNITVHNVKNIDEKSFIITVDAKDAQKVFTICGNMWYNKLIKLSGFQAVYGWIKRHIVLCVGIVILFIVAYCFDNLLLNVEIQGVSRVSESEVMQKLELCGVKKYSRFSTLDYQQIKKEVSSLSENFAYVSVKKSGNRLIIDISESFNDSSLKDYSKKQITATISGKVVSASVYRGQLVKNVGDFVNVGEVLIEGVFTFNEESFETYAFGKVVIEVESNYEYFAKTDDELEKAKAIALAKFNCENSEAELKNITVKPFAEGYSYQVVLYYYVECGG